MTKLFQLFVVSRQSRPNSSINYFLNYFDNLGRSRHCMIVRQIMNGIDFVAIADMCGISNTQVELLYYYLIIQCAIAVF